MTLLEICLDDLAGVTVADRAGADRIELCSALGDGGLTPSIGTVATALRLARRIGVNVLVRQRPGDFVYTDDEVEAMVADIRAIRSLPRPEVPLGFVIGALRPDGTLDLPALTRLREACGDAPGGVTFHKAFDQVPDRRAALETLVELGFARVLTSAGAATAPEGAEALAELVSQAAGRLVVLAGGGVRAGNVAELVRRSGVAEVHLRAAEEARSAAAGKTTMYDSGTRAVTSARVVEGMLAALGRGRA